MGVAEASSILKKVSRKLLKVACGSFSITTSSATHSYAISSPSAVSPTKSNNIFKQGEESIHHKTESLPSNTTSKSLCPICLETLTYNTDNNSPAQAIFTAQCSHAFHFACISSNVRHGSVTCPICRAQWTQLPRNLIPSVSSANQNDPVLRILDDSIATIRVHRRSFLRSARYDDDDPIEPDQTHIRPRLDFTLIPIPTSVMTLPSSFRRHLYTHSPSRIPEASPSCTSSMSCRRAAYLAVKLSSPQSTDLVMVASPNGPHLRLLKQSMALVVFSLRPMDRLAIVTYSSAAARVFPLRRMTSCGKRTALQVIDRLFYMGQADPIEGLKKGIKILEDRSHKNPRSSILHLSDSPTYPTRSYHGMNMQVDVPIHRFHVGFGVRTSNGFVMHEFEEFLARLLRGAVREILLRIKEEGRVIRLGELSGGEERKILVELGEHGSLVHVGYSYVEDGVDECVETGETVVAVDHKRETSDDDEYDVVVAGRDIGGGGVIGRRCSNVESWDYHDPYMARRWAKHLHGL